MALASPLIYLKLIGAMFMWGGTWIAGRVVAQELPAPLAAAAVRFLLAGLVLAGVALLSEGATPELKVEDLKLEIVIRPGSLGTSAEALATLVLRAASGGAVLGSTTAVTSASDCGCWRRPCRSPPPARRCA